MYGFIRKDMGDHEFARWLTKRKATDNFKHRGKSASWRNPDGKVVAVAFYDNQKLRRETWLAESEVNNG